MALLLLLLNSRGFTAPTLLLVLCRPCRLWPHGGTLIFSCAFRRAELAGKPSGDRLGCPNPLVTSPPWGKYPVHTPMGNKKGRYGDTIVHSNGSTGSFVFMGCQSPYRQGL